MPAPKLQGLLFLFSIRSGLLYTLGAAPRQIVLQYLYARMLNQVPALVLVTVNGDNIWFHYEFEPVIFWFGCYRQFIILTCNIKAYHFGFHSALLLNTRYIFYFDCINTNHARTNRITRIICPSLVVSHDRKHHSVNFVFLCELSRNLACIEGFCHLHHLLFNFSGPCDHCNSGHLSLRQDKPKADRQVWRCSNKHCCAKISIRKANTRFLPISISIPEIAKLVYI